MGWEKAARDEAGCCSGAAAGSTARETVLEKKFNCKSNFNIVYAAYVVHVRICGKVYSYRVTVLS